MLPNNTSRVRRESLEITSIEQPGWHVGSGEIPAAGQSVYCVEGEAEVLRVLGRVSDGSRLLELRLPDRPKPYFASSNNVLVRAAPAD